MKNKLEWTHNPIPTIISHLSVYQITGVRTPTELRRDVFSGFSLEQRTQFILCRLAFSRKGCWEMEIRAFRGAVLLRI